MMPAPNRSRAAPDIDVLLRSPLWNDEPTAEATVREAIAAAIDALPGRGAELAVVLADDEAIRALNYDWRGIDKPTNVLSFPAKAPRDGAPAALLGDIVIAYETVAREAAEAHKPFAHHLAHLVVHGFLHLIGYDHATDADADKMEDLERDILARLQVPDPYRLPEAGDA